MQRGSSTVVALVGAQSGNLPGALGRGARVRIVEVDSELPALDRAVAAQGRVGAAGATVTVHDADPLADVADAWVRLFDGAGAIGELEVAVQAVLARWRAGTLELPDYYLVLKPDELPATRRHWYLGALTAAAASRVVPLRGEDAVPTALRQLPSGRWWPRLDRLLEDIDRQVPDRLSAGEQDGDGERLLPAR